MSTDYFSTLPRKLRHEVYHYLWCDTSTIELPKAGHKIFIAYYNGATAAVPVISPDNPPLSGLPLWLLTNKTILTEGAVEFERQSSFLIWSPSDSTNEPFTLPNILSPARVGNVNFLSFEMTSNLPLGFVCQLWHLELTPSDSLYLKKLLDQLAITKKAKTLRIILKTHEGDDLKYSMSLAPLTSSAPSLHWLKKLEIQVEDNVHGVGRVSFEGVLKREVEKLGKKVMGRVNTEVKTVEKEGDALRRSHLLWTFGFNRE